MANRRFIFLMPLVVAGSAFAEAVDVTVRHAPYLITTTSTKSEHAWATCQYCGSKTSYSRTYRWDVYNKVWVETTDESKVPNVCRKCRAKGKTQEKLDMKERELDRKLKVEETRARIREKNERLRQLRNENR